MNYEDAVGQGVPEMREGCVHAENNSASTQPFHLSNQLLSGSPASARLLSRLRCFLHRSQLLVTFQKDF